MRTSGLPPTSTRSTRSSRSSTRRGRFRPARRGPSPSRPGASGAITIISRRNSAGSSSSKADDFGPPPEAAGVRYPRRSVRDRPGKISAGAYANLLDGRLAHGRIRRAVRAGEHGQAPETSRIPHRRGLPPGGAPSGAGGLRGVRRGSLRALQPRVPVRLVPRRDRGALRLPRHCEPGGGRRHHLRRRRQPLLPPPVRARRRPRPDGVDVVRACTTRSLSATGCRRRSTRSRATPACSWRTWWAASRG